MLKFADSVHVEMLANVFSDKVYFNFFLLVLLSGRVSFRW